VTSELSQIMVLGLQAAAVKVVCKKQVVPSSTFESLPKPRGLQEPTQARSLSSSGEVPVLK
jgi:hypothetical protein